MKCRICENFENNKPYEVREMMFGFYEVFSYFQCSKCGCLQLSDVPEDMSRYYPVDYYSFSLPIPDAQHNSGNAMKLLAMKARNDYAIFEKGFIGKFLYHRYPNRTLREKIYMYFPDNAIKNLVTKKSKILDVGCGNGSFLYLLRENGFKNLLGIDPFIKNDIRYANGLPILKKSIHRINTRFDLIMFHHSFEHVPDPLETLQSASHLLTKNGICIIWIPTVSSYAWEHYRQDWVQLDAPRHFFLHSVESIGILSAKANLHLKKIIYDSTEFQFWGSEQYKNNIPLMSQNSYAFNRANSIFSNEQIENFKTEAARLNQKNMGDQAVFYLKNV